MHYHDGCYVCWIRCYNRVGRRDGESQVLNPLCALKRAKFMLLNVLQRNDCLLSINLLPLTSRVLIRSANHLMKRVKEGREKVSRDDSTVRSITVIS